MRALSQIVALIDSQILHPTAPIIRRIWTSITGWALTFEAGILFFATGIALYFSLPFEPSHWMLGVAVFISIAVRWVARLHEIGVLDALFLILFGLFWSAFQTAMDDPNPLEFEQRLDIAGYIAGVDNRPPMRRLLINVNTVEKTPETGRPHQLRIRVGKNFPAVALGDHLRLAVVAGPIPGPVVPHGYDPARRAFFDGLAGSGYAIAEPEFISGSRTWRQGAALRIDQVRRGLADRVLTRAPPETAGLQAALLTGIRDYIPPEQTDALRASGLAHILAISGLHMGMVAFGIFAVVATGLAMIEPLGRSRDARKPAAIIAMISAVAYLLLSGGSVATQRAFIMVSIAFLAVLLDRRAISVRSVAVAALVTLLIRPEALMSVGFQMSFAAVAALVAAYRAYQDRRTRFSPRDLRNRIFGFYGSLAMTSVIAGFATGGFALFHFGRVANYGLLGNLAAMSVFPLVMATGLVSFVLMPISLDGVTLALMGKLIGFMLIVAEWVADLPGALGYVKASHPLALAAYGLGFAVLCFGTRRSVTAGSGMITIGLALWVASPTDDLRISETGYVSVLNDGQALTSSLRGDRFGRARFAQSVGNPEQEWRNYRDDFAECDDLGCRITVGGKIVTIIDAPSEVPDACRDSDLVILTERGAGPVAKRNCRAVLIDEWDRSGTGGLHIRFDKKVRVRSAYHESRRNRPWG